MIVLRPLLISEHLICSYGVEGKDRKGSEGITTRKEDRLCAIYTDVLGFAPTINCASVNRNSLTGSGHNGEPLRLEIAPLSKNL